MNLLKGSLQDELDQFFQVVNKSDFEERYVSKAAFSKARANLSHTAFVAMNKSLTDSFYSDIEYKTWKGFRLIAVDGSTLKLPSTESVSNFFGRRIPKEVPQAKISSRYDVLNKICLELLVEPWDGDERNLAHLHLRNSREEDLVLYDRGYPCFSLYSDHMQRGSQFVMRLAKNWSKETIDFQKSFKREDVVELNAHRPETKKRCLDNGVSADSIKVRLIKVKLSTGETELLITSLLDKSKYPQKIFENLYGLRWGVEEDYKTKKVWMEFENFSGKSSESVLQDLFAKVFTQNIVAVISFGAIPLIDGCNKNRKYKYQINRAQAISKIKNKIYLMVGSKARKVVESLIILFSKTIEPIRLGRSVRRTKKFRNRIFSPQYKTVR